MACAISLAPPTRTRSFAGMLKTLPYNALRTLEAVVRLEGFGRAAQDLNVTQSAVSQHVKQLEEWLGHPLLIRRSRQTIPTDQGARLAQAVRAGFGTVQQLCDELRDSKNTEREGLLVATPPGFGFIWLLPRLFRFDAAYPTIPISLSSDPTSQAPNTSDADVILSYSAGGFPKMHAQTLMSETMSPVCAPELAAHIHSVDDIAKHVMLLDTMDIPDHLSSWAFWAKEVGVKLPHSPRTRKFGQANMVVQAAISGSGIAMGRGPLVADALQAGMLVHPFPEFAHSQFSYWFVCKHEALDSPSVLAFRDWLLQEARA